MFFNLFYHYLLSKNKKKGSNMSQNVTISNWLVTWLNVYVKAKNQENTYLSYHFTIKMILRHNPSYQITPLNQPTELDMQEMINRLYDCHYSKSTLEKACTVMRQAYEAAIRNQLCTYNPAIALNIPINADKQEVVALTQEEQEMVEAAANQDILGHLVIFFFENWSACLRALSSRMATLSALQKYDFHLQK